jgi:transcriptional regulator with XRE-family HTH domain
MLMEVGVDTAQPAGGPTVLRRLLGAQLRRLRERQGITREEAGYAIRASGSKMSRLELGRVGFKERDVADLLTLYGVADPDEREQFLQLARRSREPDWWHRFNDLMPKWFEDYLGLEETATRIQAFEVQYVPGLLQTEQYARAIAIGGRPETATGDIEGHIALRTRRQQILFGARAPRLWAIIDESVLHRPIGGRQTMLGQIERLLDLTALGNISLQVVPYHRSGYSAESAFSLLRFAEAELPDIVYVQHLTGAIYLERLDDVEVYGRAFDRLAVDAETPHNSRQMLAKMRNEL